MEIIQLKVGKNSIISLPGLAMSGYLWRFQADRQDVVSVMAYQDNTSPKNLKAGETLPSKFKVEALKPGSAKIVFTQKRSWETDIAARATLVFMVMVS
ncbi:protease inhibitor I42 family protein [Mucilaginibacter sp.]|uniref:protease inhibitor I42 family protein n=1 Tax=Mucilaginibacter sp. TaxID=1882438 RepID=UPI003AFF9A1C